MEFEFERIQTGISGSYWCVPGKKGKYDFTEANLGPEMTRAETAHTAWFDELFDGGLLIPRRGPQGSPNNVSTIMLSGPPGTGKSTLALELCYRLATNKLNRDPDSKALIHLRSAYLTTEGHPPWLIKHGREFGWDPKAEILGEENPHCFVDVRNFKTQEDIERLDVASGTTSPFEIFKSFVADVRKGKPFAVPPVDWETRDIVVFDNLTTIAVPEKDWVAFLKRLGDKGPRIVVIILDASSGDPVAKKWEYLSDIVIHLERDYPDGYMIRTMEIMKARYQHHVMGRQQVRLLPRSSVRDEVPTRQHPYREQGGVFVYPSMHFVLSRHNFVAGNSSDETLDTPFPHLNELLNGRGFSVGRCVALTGQRGTHKSRLAYIQLLHTLSTQKLSKGVLISLDDDEETTKRILRDIATSQFPRSHLSLKTLIDSGRLEIAYYPPGLITPEEFFHRILLSVSRLRQDNPHPVILVFSSLEVLSSHFPLCAKHSIFIPALIELLGYRKITSFFVATSEAEPDRPVRPGENSGLLSMADPILRFERMPLSENMEFPYLGKGVNKVDLGLTSSESIVRMRVDRFAAGTSAGSDADVLLVPKGHKLARTLGRASGGVWVLASSRQKPSLANSGPANPALANPRKKGGG
jgi:KaiC/GvpD/RAD55 family RecA-like ATPase